MTPQDTSHEPTKSAAAPASRSILRWRGISLVLCLLVLLSGGVAAWWWFRPTATIPPIPPKIIDPEVKKEILKARQAVLDEPHSAGRWGRFGKILLAHLFDREADFCFAEAARLNASDPMWPYARGMIALKRRPDQSIVLLQKAVDSKKKWTETRVAMSLQLAEALLDFGKLKESEKIYRAVQRHVPRSDRVVFGLGVIAKIRGDEPTATKLLKLVEDSPYARKKSTSHLAALARMRDDNAAANTYEKKAAKMPPDYAWPDPLLDDLWTVTFGRRARERHAKFLEEQGLYAEAAETYMHQIDIHPLAKDYVGAGINLGRILQYDRALSFLHKAIELDRKSAEAHYTLALVLYDRAEKEKAARPASPRPKKWFHEVIKHAKQTTEIRRDHGEAYVFWGLSLRQLGDSKSAVEPLRKSVQCLPNDFKNHLFLGEVLLDIGQHAEARKHLENARQLEPQHPRIAAAIARLKKKGEKN